MVMDADCHSTRTRDSPQVGRSTRTLIVGGLTAARRDDLYLQARDPLEGDAQQAR